MLQSVFLAFIISLVSFGCDDNKVNNVDLNLNFKAVFDGQPLVMMAESYDYENGAKLKFQLFQYFISSVKLIQDDGTVGEEILDVDLINFESIQDFDGAEKGISLLLKEIPEGNYAGIQLGIGVNAVLNSTVPNDYQVDHPLSGNYWEAASSYIFAKMEGIADLDGDEVFEEKLTFHIGGDPRFREVRYDQELKINSDLSTLNFLVDLKDVLVNESGEFVDFSQVTQIHNGTAATAVFMMDNLSNALKLQQP